MRLNPRAIAGAALACAAAMPCAAQPTPRKELTVAYAAMSKALKSRDMDALMQHMTPDYALMGKGKAKDAKTFKAEMALQLLMLKSITSASFRMTALKPTDAGARADVTMTVAGVLASDPKQPHALKNVEKHSDNWVKTAAGWRIRSTEPHGSQLYIDGKPFDPANPPKAAPAGKPTPKP